MKCPNCGHEAEDAHVLAMLSLDDVHEPTVAKGISALGMRKDDALKRAHEARRAAEKAEAAREQAEAETRRVKREWAERDINLDRIEKALAKAGVPHSRPVPGGGAAMSLGERILYALEPTLGDLMNARARAGAERVEAEMAVAAARNEKDRATADARLTVACAAERAAKVAEAKKAEEMGYA